MIESLTLQAQEESLNNLVIYEYKFSIKNGSNILRNKFIPNSELDTEILMAKTSIKIENIFY